MARKRHKAVEMVAQADDVLVSQGTKVSYAVRSIRAMDVAYYCCRREYGGLQLEIRSSG